MSVCIALAGPGLLALKPKDSISTLVQSKENYGLGIWVQVQASQLTL